MSRKNISILAALSFISAVIVYFQVSSSQELELSIVPVSVIEEVQEEEIYEEVKVLSKPKIIATVGERDLVKITLSRVQKGEFREISRDEIKKLISFYQDSDNLASAYADIISIYQSDISTASKIFLLSLLGDVATAEAAQTLMVLLDSGNNSNSQVSFVSRKAIANLVFDNSQGKVNPEVSDTLMQYWKESKNEKFKANIENAIFKIGDTKSIESIVNTLNDSSISKQKAYSIAQAMTKIRSENATAMLVAKYQNGGNSTEFNNAYIEALPLISNETAINALYQRSSTLDSSSIEDVVDSFTVAKQRNPNAEAIVKERLYENKLEFASDEVKVSIENISKKTKDI